MTSRMKMDQRVVFSSPGDVCRPFRKEKTSPPYMSWYQFFSPSLDSHGYMDTFQPRNITPMHPNICPHKLLPFPITQQWIALTFPVFAHSHYVHKYEIHAHFLSVAYISWMILVCLHSVGLFQSILACSTHFLNVKSD